jgi:hypothetical protein
MKKICLFLLFLLVFAVPQNVYANMAAPQKADIGSSITFEQNDALSVISEVLDITVHGSKADINAAYRMKNTMEEAVATAAMFLSPNIETSNVQITVNGRAVSFTRESYTLSYDTEVKTDDWQYAVLTKDKAVSYNDQLVEAIRFEMSFAPNEEYDVVVSYTYQLGGYPHLDFNAKCGQIKYYLTPAAMWKDFGGLTINLNLDEDMPVISKSNLNFKKIGPRAYQYISDTLPNENLQITIDENWYQNIFSTLRSPYLGMTAAMFLPFILIILAIIILIVWFLHRRKKR